MAVASHSTQLALYKRLYPKGVADQMYKRSSLLADCKKDTAFGGEGAYVNITTSGTGGGSADFAQALANQNPSAQKRFFVTHKTEYQLATVTGRAIATSLTDKMAVLKVLKVEMDKANYKFTMAVSARVHGNGGGAIGQISAGSNVGTATITLAVTTDIWKFEIGDWVQTSTDNGTGTAPAGVASGANGNQAQILSLDRVAGTLTLSAFWNTYGAAASNFIFRSGDYAQAMTGIAGWNPITAPTAGDLFYGMDRSVGDVVRQSGDRYASPAGTSYEDTILNGATQTAQLGSMLRKGYVHPVDFTQLVKELGSKRVFDSKTKEGVSGFKAITVMTGMGDIDITQDIAAQRGYIRCLDPDDLTLATAGECPSPLNWGGADSKQILANADALQFRLGAYGEFKFEFNNVPAVYTF